MVTICERCLYPSTHPLGLVLDDEGVCSGCRIHEEKDALDWDARWRELEALVAPYRDPRARYDCVVPISGARDSHFIMEIVVERLRLKPLAVAYNKYFNTPAGVENLANLRIKYDVDFKYLNVNPEVVKKITRTSLYRYGNMYWPVLAGETVFPVQTAVRMQIPLIIWGAHQGLEQVGMFSHLHNVEMSRRYRKDHDLFGVEPNEIVGPFDTLTDDDLLNFRYPSFADIEALGLRGLYLGNYVRWDPLDQHRTMVENRGFQGQRLARTFDPYDHADCFAYMGVHDLLKYFKFGYGKARDQACREIRHGRLDRTEAARLVAACETEEPAHMDLFAEWLGVPEETLAFILNRFRNPKVWEEVEPNVWRRRDGTGDAAAIARSAGVDASELAEGRARRAPPWPTPGVREAFARDDPERRYITIGRGVKHPSPPPAPSPPVRYVG